MTPLVDIPAGRLYFGTAHLEAGAGCFIPRGVTAVVGPNGAGKSLLADIIERGRNFRTNRVIPTAADDFRVKKVEFSDIHSLRGINAAGYYQQRYEATMNDEVPRVREALAEAVMTPEFMAWCGRLGLGDALDKRINYLSSGELRKLLVASALSSDPTLLILDNPYIGLDIESRALLDEALGALKERGVSVLMLVSDPRDIPAYADAVIAVNEMQVKAPVAIGDTDIDTVRRAYKHLFDYAIDLERIPRPLVADNEPADTVVSFNGVRVSYGPVTILPSVTWTVRTGERWALSGPNGSGKSTLLSMVNADNPAAYSADITIFDRRRGSGESIWDIKKRIGYVSPEMRLYFSGTGTALETVARGLNDTVGSFTPLRPEQVAYAGLWMKLLHMEHLSDRQFNTLSSGERQLVLLGRALIKQPRLLILDEPMHGLDYGRKRSLRALINYMAARSDAAGRPMSLIYVTHDPYDMPECVTHTFNLAEQ